MANSKLGRADRFYSNPILRDQEWFRATQPPWWLMALALAIIGVALFTGVYGEQPYKTTGWIVAGATIVIYIALERLRRRRARQELRKLHGQPRS